MLLSQCKNTLTATLVVSHFSFHRSNGVSSLTLPWHIGAVSTCCINSSRTVDNSSVARAFRFLLHVPLVATSSRPDIAQCILCQCAFCKQPFAPPTNRHRHKSVLLGFSISSVAFPSAPEFFILASRVLATASVFRVACLCECLLQFTTINYYCVSFLAIRCFGRVVRFYLYLLFSFLQSGLFLSVLLNCLVNSIYDSFL